MYGKIPPSNSVSLDLTTVWFSRSHRRCPLPSGRYDSRRARRAFGSNFFQHASGTLYQARHPKGCKLFKSAGVHISTSSGDL